MKKKKIRHECPFISVRYAVDVAALRNNGVRLIERAEVIKNYREFLEFEKSSYSPLLYSSPSSRPIPFRGGENYRNPYL